MYETHSAFKLHIPDYKYMYIHMFTTHYGIKN